jgi:hypothetical protein
MYAASEHANEYLLNYFDYHGSPGWKDSSALPTLENQQTDSRLRSWRWSWGPSLLIHQG